MSVRAEEPRSPVISSTSRRLKVVWPRSLSSTHRFEDRCPSVFDSRAEVSDFRAEVCNRVLETADLSAEVSNLGGAFCELYSVLILFLPRERNKNTISYRN